MATALEERARSRSDHLSRLANQQLTERPRLDLVRQHVFHRPEGHQSWKLLPETPTGMEIMVAQGDAEELPPNRVNGVWSSKDAYLETQYRLLRREGTEALRFVVNNYKSRKTPDDNEDVCIYSRVHVRGYLLSRLGTLCRISFSTEHAKKKINWLQSRRLMPGTLVAISPKSDNFRTICLVATVAQRPYREGLDKNPPEIDIVWADVNQSIIDPDMDLVMVEARVGYYEAVRHTLVGLQMASDSESPIFKYVLGEENRDQLASFVAQKPVLDLTPVLRPTTDATIRDWVRAYDVREPTPDIREETTMDETQLHALYRMITKELCIVQGPPGTGKTFTSVEALKVLLANQGKGDPPIIIAAQTNHALDQLLHLCLNAGARIVRVGGRTESERIAEHTMYEVRKRLGSGPDGTWRVLDSDRRKYNQEITGLANTVFNDILLEPADLLATGVLTQEQYTSLVDEDTEQTDSHQPHGPFSLWLSGEVIQTDILRNKYSEQDLAGDDEEYNKDEYEFEGELEHIAADEEDEDRIRGHFVPLVYTWAGKQPTNQHGTWQRRAERELRRSDLFEVPKNMRGAVYQVLYERYIAKLRPQFVEHFTQYNTICKELKVNKWHQDAVMVETLRLNIVGCTTTGLTKYRGFLAALGAKTMLIEEAAETRESSIVSALYPSIQQLILVGDHQQLTPFSNVRWLSQAPYYLDLSMFERMVDYLGIPYIMLDKQRRMAPEIRAIVDTFYDGLEDHPVALEREPVPGMGDRRTWLFNHSWEDATDANHSRFNTEEAIMIVNFFAYLVNNGTKPEKITVLTYYMAQRRLILRKLRQHPSLVAESYHVHTVDSYQGEENDVVLLSLVRSPPPHADYAVGFLDSKNRAIVAISRARRGFYVFGNIVNAINATKQSSEIWGPILNTFIQQDRVDQLGLPLECQPHGKLIWIKNTGAWGDNAGGCDQRCTFVRTCGHQCTLTCHVKSHEQFRCSQVCGKMLACGHKCQIWCKDPCNCVCEEFQSVKQAVRTRQVQDEARLHMDLEDILRQEAEARPTVQTRLIQGETLVPVDLDEFLNQEPIVPARATQAAVENRQEEARLHMNLEDMLLQEAGIPASALQLQGTQPHVNALPVASKSREVVRLGPGQLRMTAPPNGKTGGRATPNMKSPASMLMNPPPGQRSLPPMVPPGQKPLPAPRTQGSLPPMIPPRARGATNGAGNSYQHFAQNVVAHDRAHVKAQRAALAKSSGVQPDIRETYRPVALVDGQRVDTPSGGNSPQKVIKALTTDHAELPADNHVPDLITNEGMGMADDQWESFSGGTEAVTEPGYTPDILAPRVASTNGSRGMHEGPPGSSKTGSIPVKVEPSNAGFVATVTGPDHRSSPGYVDLMDAAMEDLGGGQMQPLTSAPSQSYGDLNSWMEELTVGPPPESVATRPSSADDSEFRRRVQESDVQNSLID